MGQRVSPGPDLSYTKKALFHTLVPREALTPPLGPGANWRKSPVQAWRGGWGGQLSEHQGIGKHPGLAEAGEGTPNRCCPPQSLNRESWSGAEGPRTAAGASGGGARGREASRGKWPALLASHRPGPARSGLGTWVTTRPIEKLSSAASRRVLGQSTSRTWTLPLYWLCDMGQATRAF